MRRHALAARTGALLGALVGLAIGVLRGSTAWPWLSLASALQPAAVGWLLGAAISAISSLALSRSQPIPARVASTLVQRLLGVAFTALAIAPIGIWLWASARAGLPFAARASQLPRPNIVLITIDALRADHLGCYGSDQGLAPNIDAFAQSATRYDDAYVSSPWTLTSLASMFSQLTPSECGLKVLDPEMHEWYSKSARLPDGVPLLTQQLQDAGYTTAAELTNGFLTAERGWQRGFDWFRNEDCGEEGAVSTRADNVTRNALSWLRLNRRQPFFLWVHYIDPHLPYDSPDTPDELRARYSRGWPTRREYWYETMRGAPNEVRTRYQDFCRAMYAEEVRYADRWVGELLECLRAAADFDNCLIVISSDHGEELFDHGEFEHGHSLYEEVLRVPLLVKWPAGQQADKQVTRTVGLIALARTFLDAAGVPPGDADEAAALPRRDGGPDTAIYSEGLLWGIERTSLTTGDHKIIYHPFRQPHEQRFEVYDRRRDRTEQHDLAHSGEAADLRGRLTELTASSEAACRQWRRSGKQDFDGLDLPDRTRERLKALGYLGD